MFFISLCIYHGKLTKSVEHIFVIVKKIICSAKKETISIHIFVTVSCAEIHVMSTVTSTAYYIFLLLCTMHGNHIFMSLW